MAHQRTWVMTGSGSTSVATVATSAITGTDYPQVGDVIVVGVGHDNSGAAVPTLSSVAISGAGAVDSWRIKSQGTAAVSTAGGSVQADGAWGIVTTAFDATTVITATLSAAVSAKGIVVGALIGSDIVPSSGTAGTSGTGQMAANSGLGITIGVSATENNAALTTNVGTSIGTVVGGSGGAASRVSVNLTTSASGGGGITTSAPTDGGYTYFGFKTLQAVDLTSNGIGSGEAFGSPSITSGSAATTLSPTGIATGEGFGTPTASTPLTVSPTGIASGEALGTPIVATPLVASPSSIASAEAFGSPTISMGAAPVVPTGIASVEAFGTLVRGGEFRMYANYSEPSASAADFAAVNVGMEFYSTQAAYLTQIRWWQPSTGADTGQRRAGVWQVAAGAAGTLLASTSLSSPSGSGWQTIVLSTPVALTANTRYRVAVYHTGGGYTAVANYYSSGSNETDGYLVVPKAANATDGLQNSFDYTANLTEPRQTFNDTHYGIDVTVDTRSASGSITASPSGIATAEAFGTLTANVKQTISPVGIDPPVSLTSEASYNFDTSGTTFADQSGNGHTATLTGDAAWSASGVGSSAGSIYNPTTRADGSGASIPRTASLEPTSAITIMAWIRLSQNAGGWGVALTKSRASAGDSYAIYSHHQSTGKPAFCFNTVNGEAVVAQSAAGSLPTGTWYHLAGTYDGTNGKFYIDANLENTVALTGNLVYDTSQPLTLLTSSAFPNETIMGEIDDVRVIPGVALTQAQIAEARATRVGAEGAVGNPTVMIGGMTASPSAIPTAEVFGTLSVTSILTAAPQGIASGELFGNPVIALVIAISPTGITSAEVFGTLTAVLTLSVNPSGVPPGETFGTPTISTPGGATTVSPTGIASAETFGNPTNANVGTYSLNWGLTQVGKDFVYPNGMFLDTDVPSGVGADKSIRFPKGLPDSATISFEITLDISASGNLTFYRKVSAEGSDGLRFYIDNVQQAFYGGSVAWGQVTFAITAGTHTFKWAYTKDSSVTSGSDTAWVALLSIPNVINPVITQSAYAAKTYDFEDGVIPSEISTSSWTNSTSSPISGTRSLRSPAAPAANATYDATLTVPTLPENGVIAFDWKNESETGNDLFRVIQDSYTNVLESGVLHSGTTYMIIPAGGSHTLVFRYNKDASAQLGADAAWVDNLSIPYQIPPYPSPTGIPSAEAFGTLSANKTLTVSPTAIVSAEAFGTPNAGSGLQVSPSGVGSAEAFGTPVLTPGALTVSPTGVATGEAFGIPVITSGGIIVSPTAIASAQVLGTPTISLGVLTVVPTGISGPGGLTWAQALANLGADLGLAWQFDETSGTSAADGSGNGKTGTIIGATSLGQAGLIQDGGTSFGFAANGDGVTLASEGTLSASQWTVLFAAKTNSTAEMTLAQRFGASGIGTRFQIKANWGTTGKLTVQNDQNLAFCNTALSINDNVKRVFAVRQDATTLKIFVDGTQDATVASTAAGGAGSAALYVGSNNSALKPWVGTIDGFVIVKRALTNQEITDLTAIANTAPDTGFGLPTITQILTVVPDAIISTGAFGTVTLSSFLTAAPTGILSAEAMGTPTATWSTAVNPVSIASAESVSPVVITAGGLVLSPNAIATLEAFGTPVISKTIPVAPTGIPSAELFGNPSAVLTLTVNPSAIPSTEVFGTLVATISPDIRPLPIASLEAFGNPTATGGQPTTNATAYTAGVGIEVGVYLTGTPQLIWPAPIPPSAIAPLPDPTVAPTLTSSDTGPGALPDGTYRYSYAGWRGTIAQCTAPSPTADITITADDTVTLSYPVIPGADGYIVYREKIA